MSLPNRSAPIDLGMLRQRHDLAVSEGRSIEITPRALAQVIVELEAGRRAQAGADPRGETF